LFLCILQYFRSEDLAFSGLIPEQRGSALSSI
jgi:hypothetical protein